MAIAKNSLALLILACAILFSGNAFAASGAKAAPGAKAAAQAGKEVKTKYFSLVIPKGWAMARELRKSPRGLEAIFANNKANIGVELSALDSTLSAKEMAEVTTRDFRAKKLDVSDPVQDGNFYTMEVQGGPMPYRCWVGANGKFATLTIVMGNNIQAANELLQRVKTDVPGSFPASVGAARGN